MAAHALTERGVLCLDRLVPMATTPVVEGLLDTPGYEPAQAKGVQAKPGIYVLACFMDTQDGREHTRLGMLRTIRIAK